MPFNDVLFMGRGETIIRVVPSHSTTDSNSVIEEYFQFGPDGAARAWKRKCRLWFAF